MNAINGQMVRSADGARFEVRPVSEIDPSPFNHRKFFNPVEMWEMALSIVDHGVDTEAHARPHPDDPTRLQLSSGHRRRLGTVIAVLIREGLTETEYFTATRGSLTPADGDKPAIWMPPSKEEQAAWQARLEAAAPRALLPCKVREMSDEEVLEDQGAENLQRSAPNCLEVADYFDTLMRPRPAGMGMTLDQVETKTRKDRGFIVRHLKLLKLAPEVREALEKDEFGEQGEAYALLLARIPTHGLQVAALERVLLREQRRFRNDESALLSLTDTKKMISQHFMMALVEGQTPFDMANAGLVDGRPACGPCEDRTGNQRALFADVASGSVCTNVECYQAKTKAQMLLDAQRDGAKVLSDAAARKTIRYGRVDYDSGYVELDDTVYEPGGRQRKWREILKGKMPPETRAFHEGQRYDLVKKDDAKKILDQVLKEKAAKKKEAGPAKLTPTQQKERDRAADEREKAKADAEIRQLAMRAAIKVWPANPSEELLRALAEAAIHGAWADTQVEAVAVLELGDIKAKNGSRGAGAGEMLGKYVKGLKSKSSLLGFVALLMFGRSLSSTWDSRVTGRLKELCEHTGADFGAIEKEVRGKYSKAKKEKAARKKKREEAETKKAERAKTAKGKAGKKGAATAKGKAAQPGKASAPKKASARARAPKASKDLPFDEREEAKQDEPEATQEQACEICHCTESNACKHPDGHPCSWADLDLTLCSVCMELLEAVEEQLLEGPKAEAVLLAALSELTSVEAFDDAMGRRVLARMEREGTIVKKDGRWALVQDGEPVPPQPEKKSRKTKSGKTAPGAGRGRAQRAPAVDLEALDTDDGAPSEPFESYEPGEAATEDEDAPAPKPRAASWRRVWAGRGPAHTARALAGGEPSHTVCGLPITAKMKEPPPGVKDCASCERMRESDTAHGATVAAPPPAAEPAPAPPAPRDMTNASVLASLAEAGPGQIGDVAARFGRKPMALSPILFQLQAATLVTFDKANGRVWTITAAGRDQLAAAAEVAEEKSESSMAGSGRRFSLVIPPSAEDLQRARRRSGVIGELDPSIVETFRAGFEKKLLALTAEKWLTVTEISELLEGLPATIIQSALERLLVEGKMARGGDLWSSEAPPAETTNKPKLQGGRALMARWPSPATRPAGKTASDIWAELPADLREGVERLTLEATAGTWRTKAEIEQATELNSDAVHMAILALFAHGKLTQSKGLPGRSSTEYSYRSAPPAPPERAEVWSEGVKTTTGKMAACAEAIRAYLGREDVLDVTDEQLAVALPDFDKGLVGMMILNGAREVNGTRKIVRDPVTTVMRLASKAPEEPRAPKPAAKPRKRGAATAAQAR